MRDEIRQHYLGTSTYTYAGPYLEYFKSLPDDISELGNLICSQVIHRVTLAEGNTNANETLRYGDMNMFPWYRMRCEDDIFLTAIAMTAELFRMDRRGFILDRKVEDKIVVTCRYVSVLMTAILKAKGVPARSRSGFATYFDDSFSYDHWINQYWDEDLECWVNIDADGFFDRKVLGFDQYNIPFFKFDWAASTWLGIRDGSLDRNQFLYASGSTGLKAVIRAIFYDFHCLMNNEISYNFQPAYIDGKFEQLSETELKEIDKLARLILNPDENYKALKEEWETNRKFRILNSPLVGDSDTIPRNSNSPNGIHLF